MGPLSPINDLAGMLIQQYGSDIDEDLEMVFQQELAEAKSKGLSAVQSFVFENSNLRKGKYDLITISSEIASKLIMGEFKTFEKLKEYIQSSIAESNLNIHVLYRRVQNKNRGNKIYIIESFFIDE